MAALNSSDYDNTEYNQVEYDVLTLQCMICSDDPIVKQYTESQVMKAISKLNLGKAPDSHGLTVEHLRFGGPRLIKYITVLCNAPVLYSQLSEGWPHYTSLEGKEHKI